MAETIVTLDVRGDIRSGRSPLASVLETVAKLGPGATLRLLAPFEPVPLFDLLGQQGFRHAARPISATDWEVLFTRTAGSPLTAAELAVQPTTDGGCSTHDPKNVVAVDARGLEPPQPMVRILEAVAALRLGTVLHAHTDRRPMHLYAQLEARGFTGETQEQADGSYITQICRS